jgi:hypothetical protein
MRKPHAEKRIEIDEVCKRYFYDRMNALYEDYLPELIFNLDETCWRLFEAPRRILEDKWRETVKLRLHMNEKKSSPVFGGIACSGGKLLLWVLAKGKTTQTETKFGPQPGLIMKHTESGWATQDLIVEYLQWLHTGIADRHPCVLILDVYPDHQKDAIVAAAEECDIEFVFVPVGRTKECHPLNSRIFKELKSRARAEIARLMFHVGRVESEHDQSVTILERC